MQKQQQLFRNSKNYLKLATTIMQHRNQGRTRKNKPQVRQKQSTTF